MPTDPRSEAAVRRLYAALRQALRGRSGAATDEVTVSEIYQTLVPYARARAELGFEMNADYEHALMRLLAGEGGFARMDQPEAHAQVAREVASGHPDVTLYRRFAACTVRLSGGAPGADAEPVSVSPVPPASTSRTDPPRPESPAQRVAPGGPDPDATWGDALQRIQAGALPSRNAADSDAVSSPSETPSPSRGMHAASDVVESTSETLHPPPDALEAPSDALKTSLDAPRSTSDAPAPTGPPGTPAPSGSGGAGSADHPRAEAEKGSPGSPEESPEGGAEGATEESTGPSRGRPEACGSCGQGLPSDRDARFCPYCGSEQPLECAACGDDLREDWRFCPSCGTEA